MNELMNCMFPVWLRNAFMRQPQINKCCAAAADWTGYWQDWDFSVMHGHDECQSCFPGSAWPL